MLGCHSCAVSPSDSAGAMEEAGRLTTGDFWAGTSARTKRASCPRGKEKVGRLLGPQSFPYLLAVHSWAMHCTFPRLDVFTIWRVVTALGHAVVVITC